MDKQQNKIPQVRFPEFEEEWEVKRLEEVLIYTPRPKPKPKSNYLSIGLRSHFKGTFQKPNTDPSKNAMEILYEVKENDFIVNITFAWEGALAIVSKEDDGGFVSHRFPTFNFEKEFNNLFFKYLFFREKSKHQLGIVSPGGAGRNRVMNKKDFIKIKLPFPTLAEQQKIAHFFSIVDKKLNQLQEKKTALELYKKGMMQQIFSQQLRFKDENGEDFPDWEEKKLGEVGKVIGGGTPDSNNLSYWEGKTPWVSSSDIFENEVHKISITRFISKKAIDESATKLIPKNSILIVSRVGLGKFAVSNQELCTSQDFSNFIPFNSNSFFLAYYFSQQKNRFLQLAQGTSIKGFTGKDIRNLNFNIPSSIKEQTKIANFLSKIDDKINTVTEKIEQTKAYKKGLLQKMFCN